MKANDPQYQKLIDETKERNRKANQTEDDLLDEILGVPTKENFEKIEMNKKLSEIHDCDKCRGKIVCIEIDKLGVTRCAYCHEVVDYSEYNKEELEKFLISNKFNTPKVIGEQDE